LRLGASRLPSHTGKACVPLNADEIPYVVIPAAAPKGIDDHQFEALSKLRVGDYGVVIANGTTVPVIVGDEGPAYKIGEVQRRCSERSHPTTKCILLGRVLSLSFFRAV